MRSSQISWVISYSRTLRHALYRQQEIGRVLRNLTRVSLNVQFSRRRDLRFVNIFAFDSVRRKRTQFSGRIRQDERGKTNGEKTNGDTDERGRTGTTNGDTHIC